LGKNWCEQTVGGLVAAASPERVRACVSQNQISIFNLRASSGLQAIPYPAVVCLQNLKGSLPRSQAMDRRSTVSRRVIWRENPSSAASAVQPRVLRYTQSPGTSA